MFHSAAVKLTLWYLAIIMALSIGCSLALYRVSSNELTKSASRPVDIYNLVFGPDSSGNVAALRGQQLQKDKNHLRSNLVVFNIVVFLAGGGVSYFLARRTLRPIEESLEMQKRFSGDASHELRTPLTAMQTEIEVALRNPNFTNNDAVALLKSNLEEVGKLKALSEGLLTLATTNFKDSDMEQVNISEVVELAIEQVKKVSKSSRVAIHSKLQDISTNGNPQQLANLVAILLDNAVKYSPSGDKVRVEVKAKDKQALIKVIDHGQGIASADLPHIFERFYRADSSRTKNQTHGYGLGLAIAKKITDLHRGSIDVKSAPGKGSTFTVRLPLVSK